MEVTLHQTTSYFGENAFFHNKTSIKDYYQNKRIPSGSRITTLFAYFYSHEKNINKKPEERIIIQNSALLQMLGYNVPSKNGYKSYDYEKHLSMIQSTLERYELDNFWHREFENKEGKWIKLYIIDENGQRILNPEAHGLTNRRIVLNAKKIKELFTILPKDAQANEIKQRSRSKRMLNNRPLTLIDHLMNKFIKVHTKDQVKSVQEKKRIVNVYLEKQAKKYGDFSSSNDINGYELDPFTKEATKTLRYFIEGNPRFLKLSDMWNRAN